MQESNCVFCKIARGEIPATKVYEDDRVIAFLDIGPLAEGHTLLIPKRHFGDIRDADGDILADLLRIVPRLARAIMQATGASGLNLLQNTGASSGQAVFHLHFHLIPRIEGDRLGFRWNAGKYAEGRAEHCRKKITEALLE